jgi:hypothetical protein
VKTTFVKRKPTVEQAEDSRSSDPILPLAIAYVLTIVVVTVICTYFSGDPIVSIVLVGFGVTGAIRFMLHVLSFFKRPAMMPARPRKIAGLWRKGRRSDLKFGRGRQRHNLDQVAGRSESACSRN